MKSTKIKLQEVNYDLLQSLIKTKDTGGLNWLSGQLGISKTTLNNIINDKVVSELTNQKLTDYFKK